MKFEIGKKIGDGEPVFIIAELSANHLHRYDIAEKTLIAAKEAGADAIKLQTYTADTITIDCDKEIFKIKGTKLWDNRTLYDLYKEGSTPWEWQPKLMKKAHELGLVLFSSPFDKTAVDFLEKLNVPAYKLASFEITDIPLIEYIAKKNKPILIATGIAEMSDIEEALKACRRCGNNQIVLLKCSSAYPSPVEDLNLNTIKDMASRFKTMVGLSDHSMSIEAPISAVALGAKIIEKHLILDRKLGGPDCKFSLEPQEFKDMVQSVRRAEAALGEVTYKLPESARNSRNFARSLFAVADIKLGEKFTEKNIRSIRPGNGLHPREMPNILGKTAAQQIKRGTPLKQEMIK